MSGLKTKKSVSVELLTIFKSPPPVSNISLPSSIILISNPKFFEDIKISEAEGWNQIELKLSKPATETFTLEYNLDNSSTATQNDDFWWWSDESGYRLSLIHI